MCSCCACLAAPLRRLHSSESRIHALGVSTCQSCLQTCMDLQAPTGCVTTVCIAYPKLTGQTDLVPYRVVFLAQAGQPGLCCLSSIHFCLPHLCKLLLQLGHNVLCIQAGCPLCFQLVICPATKVMYITNIHCSGEPTSSASRRAVCCASSSSV